MDNSPLDRKRRSIRLPYFDYSQPAAYFITICARERKPLFGEVILGKTALNASGKIVEECWLELPRHVANAQLGPFVVMPNHLHGILILNQSAHHAVPKGIAEKRRFGAVAQGSVSAIVRSFKAASTLRIRRAADDPTVHIWQRNYYEHVIRDADDFQKTAEYIRRNPERWENRKEAVDNGGV